MILNKNAAELCVLLIRELYGQLPARAFATLLSKGRTSARDLARNTSMNPRQVRHALILLIQQNLTYHHTDHESNVVHYEANSAEAYNLVRIGKVLDLVHRKYGDDALSVVRSVLRAGNIKVAEIVEAFSSVAPKTTNGSSHAEFRANGASPETPPISEDAEVEEEASSAERVYDTVAQLIASGILVPVFQNMFQSDEDIRADVARELSRSNPSAARGGGKQLKDHDLKVDSDVRDIIDERRVLKRQLEARTPHHVGTKRRRLANGLAGFVSANHFEADGLQPSVVVRVDYQKCIVELRNQKLTEWVEEEIGHTTSEVYAAALSAITKKVVRCQNTPEAVKAGHASSADANALAVTTLEIFEHLSPNLDVFGGLGKAEPHQINQHSAEKILKNARAVDDGHVSSDEEDDDYPMPNGINTNGVHGSETKITKGQNGTRETKVKFEDRVHSRSERIQQMRQHLLVLAESSEDFIRHCGIRDQGEWTVDFECLVDTMKRKELDTLIEEAFGRPGLRLVRILRERGKLDDKTLPNLALMKKADVHVKMTEMELAGYLDVQEVPRDNNRTASRTIFLWFFDEAQTLARVLDNTLKSMVRHLERLEIERRRKKNVLSVAERRDVQGFEEEKLRRDVYNEYQEFLDIETKLLGQVGRLDDLVAIFRDF